MNRKELLLHKYITVSDIQEALVTLYLRLNGYLSSSFIVHASQEEGRQSLRTEIDILAVRFPYNEEPAREVQPSEYLGISNEFIDIIIAEVKSGGQRLQFNSRLREFENLYSVLQWLGAFHSFEIDEIIHELMPQLQPRETNSPDSIIEVTKPFGRRIRAILFHVDRKAPTRNSPFFIGSSELMSFISNCLLPNEPREECQTRYDFTSWGPIYEPIIRYFKENQEIGTVEDVVSYVYPWIESRIMRK